MSPELQYCLWVFPPFWLWVFSRRDKEEGEDIGVEVIASGIATAIIVFCVFCVITAIKITWGPH